MKKLALAVCSVFVLTSLSFAGPGMEMYGHKDGYSKEEKEARKAKMEIVKKDFMEYQKNLDALIEKYNKADEKGKSDVKKEVTTLVATQTDKEIVSKKEMLENQKARIAKLEENITDLEANKSVRINEKVDFVISPEGQAKMKEKKDKMEKMKSGKKDKKDKKKSK